MRTSNIVAKIATALVLSSVFCFNCANAAPADAPINYGNNPAAGKTFNFNGTHFYYETYGHGEPILLIHGNGGAIVDFKEQIPVYAKNHQVFVMDSRGQGKSELNTDKLTYEQFAEDSNAFLDSLKIKQVKVLGWSDGGIVGLLLTIHHPDKVAKLAVMGANLNPEAAYQWALDGIVKMRSKINGELAHGGDAHALQIQLQLLDLLGNQPHIPLTDLNKINIPVLVMAGDRDVIRDEHTLSMFHALRQSQLAIFPGATHMVPEQDPESFNRVSLKFFDQPFSMPDTKDLGWFD